MQVCSYLTQHLEDVLTDGFGVIVGGFIDETEHVRCRQKSVVMVLVPLLIIVNPRFSNLEYVLQTQVILESLRHKYLLLFMQPAPLREVYGLLRSSQAN